MTTTTVQLIEERVRSAPGRTAVICGTTRLTYGELWGQATQVAQVLAGRPDTERTVALLGPGTAEFMTAALGAWIAGLAWVPLDPRLPAERVRHVLTDTGAGLVLDTGTTAAVGTGLPTLRVDTLPHRAPEEPVRPRATGADPAYIIYTSGSTGVPKGVRVSHHPLAVFLRAAVGAYDFTDTDVALSFASPGFDAAVEEMWAPLVAGGTVLLRGAALWTGPQMFERVRTHGVTFVLCTTAYFEAFFGEELTDADVAALGGLRGIVFGGEAVSPAVVRRWSNGPLGRIPVCNTYGPTETVVTATLHWIHQGWSGGDRVPIGHAMPGHEPVVLDEDGKGAAVGELYLGGPCVADGYLGRPDLTAERFVRLPGREGIHYRTGDLVEVGEDGAMLFLGRADRQVKVRGFRIELEEIEVALRGLGQVRNAVVALEKGPSGRDRLVAYVVPQQGGPGPDFVAGIKAALGARLPVYMVPEAVAVREELPLGVTGKVDRARVATGAGPA
ncbi:amino acid adenylation domain-containing protein [Streptomyces sp. ISL-11]|uniref:amino acid adenylation domain-containing protein n=1 Tax=Streptomyces sp. ISL-11 TaxID=2819174 RepID=UPI001BE99D09|nr:amino acid adenylation domain-containing protein [Streptomyces sp. ISL-11]MBT2383366.1 amino acid adenylation domain-containing protein [Streptomyces sp. ISL-11]